ncbi:MAG: GNAT family N-acetyltransferase [Acidimicrobiia bacterium]
MADGSITVRPFEDPDLDPVLDLMRLSLGESAVLQRTPELFAWKHFANPFGRSIMLVAESGGRIVGLRAFMRWELVTRRGEPLRCVRAVDTATHPDHQRRGIFKALTLAALDHAREDDVDLVFNTPNPKSGAGYLAMGWRQVGQLGVMAAPGLRRPLAKAPADGVPDPARWVAQARALRHAPMAGIEDRPARGLRTRRTPGYLTWRFSGHPIARYGAVETGSSTAVVRANVRSGWRELVLSDVFGPDPGRAIRATVWRNRAAYLATWFSEGSPERAAAVRSGVLTVPKVRTLTLVANPLRPIDARISSLDGWDLASSDLELL